MTETKRNVSDVIDPGPDSLMIEKASVDTLALSKAEIDLQIATAKSYPRSLAQFQKSTMEMVTYSREAAEKMYYKLPRGGKIIEGPSVRLAEIIGQNWRNCRIGARVLGNDDKTVTSQGVFHDLETNVAISFEIKRRITRKDGTRYDDDMIGVTGAAAAGIAFRNAVLKGVPKMFWQPMYEKALETARGDDKDLAPRRKAAIAEFEKMGVPEAAILATLGVTGISKIGGDELLTLRGVYNAIREGTTTAQEAFDIGPKPIEPTREVSDSSPSNEGAKKETKPQKRDKSPIGKKANVPLSGNPEVPKARIPNTPIDVAPVKNSAGVKKEAPKSPPAKEDPFISTAEQTEVYSRAVNNGWKVPDEVKQMLTKKFGCDTVRLVRRSQLPKIYEILEAGT